MKSFLFLGISSIVGLIAWVWPKPDQTIPYSDLPKTVVQFNASFNKSNDYKWQSVPTCSYTYIDLNTMPALKAKYKIKSIPTIIVFKKGQEVKRWEGDVMLKLNVAQKEILDFYKDLK